MSDISNTNNQSESELDEYGVWVKQTENPTTDVFNEEQSMDMDLPDFDLQDNFENELDKKDTDIENDIALDNFLTDFSEIFSVSLTFFSHTRLCIC